MPCGFRLIESYSEFDGAIVYYAMNICTSDIRHHDHIVPGAFTNRIYIQFLIQFDVDRIPHIDIYLFPKVIAIGFEFELTIQDERPPHGYPQILFDLPSQRSSFLTIKMHDYAILSAANGVELRFDAAAISSTRAPNLASYVRHWTPRSYLAAHLRSI